MAYSGVRQVSVTLTDAQIKALPTTPVQVVAAPGSGKVLLLLGSLITGNIVTSYTNRDSTNNGNLEYLVGGVATYDASVYFGEASGPANTGTGAVSFVLPPAVVPASSYSVMTITGDLENLSIALVMFNGALGNFTGGNAANALKVTAYYVVVSL